MNVQVAGVDNLGVNNLPQLMQHTQDLLADPNLPFDVVIFDDVYLQITDDNRPRLAELLLQPLLVAFQQTTQDPTPACSLMVKLLSTFSFGDVMAVVSAEQIIQAMQSPVPAMSKLGLELVHKASRTVDDTESLAVALDRIELFGQVVITWLSNGDVGVGKMAATVIGDVLATDRKTKPPPQTNGHVAPEGPEESDSKGPGSGEVWRLVFTASNIADAIKTAAAPPRFEQTAEALHRVTITQSRILELFPRLAALDPGLILKHHVFTFAALEMIDQEDQLMRQLWIDFWERLVSLLRVSHERSGQAAEDFDGLRDLVGQACEGDRGRGEPSLRTSLMTLPDRTIEDEAELLREYLRALLAN